MSMTYWKSILYQSPNSSGSLVYNYSSETDTD